MELRSGCVRVVIRSRLVRTRERSTNLRACRRLLRRQDVAGQSRSRPQGRRPSPGGSRSLVGSHPFWLANDRVMADEFFTGAFTNELWASGEVVPGIWYNVAIGNNVGNLGITAKQLDRSWTTGGTSWE